MAVKTDIGATLFRFGVCSDLQWADLPDGESHGGAARYYRQSLQLLRIAAADFKAQQVPFVFHLGDIVDGKQRQSTESGASPRQRSDAALQQALDAFGEAGCRIYHVIGNHCLYNFDRATLYRRLGIESTAGRGYYSLQPHAQWRIIVLDAYDLSVIGWPKDSAEHEAGIRLLRQHNSNEEWNERPAHLARGERGAHWVAYNGGVGAAQLEWLQGELTSARAAAQRAIVVVHCPIHRETIGGGGSSLLWNYDDVLEVLATNEDVVAATLAGHAHRQGQHTDSRGVQHHVLPALLETAPVDGACHGLVSVGEHGMRLEGKGAMQSTVIPWPPSHAVDAASTS